MTSLQLFVIWNIKCLSPNLAPLDMERSLPWYVCLDLIASPKSIKERPKAFITDESISSNLGVDTVVRSCQWATRVKLQALTYQDGTMAHCRHDLKLLVIRLTVRRTSAIPRRTDWARLYCVTWPDLLHSSFQVNRKGRRTEMSWRNPGLVKART